MKRITAILLFMLLMLLPIGIHAEEKVEYTGGVIFRSFPRETDARASAGNLIEVAYISPNVPYFVIEEEVYWEICVEGGATPYDIRLTLFRQDLDDSSNWFTSADYLNLGDNRSFAYTYQEDGRYFWQASITDSNGQFLVFQSRPMETTRQEKETDATTVAGKVNQIVSALITDNMSEYTRAKLLHDWLIDNAEYDYSFQNYTAAGVLLYGTGVCDSYARAYEMLLSAAGIESVYVSGTGNGGPHGWNLVKIDGVWYHVDVTWDDTSGSRYAYFCLSDEAMRASDHQWNESDTENMLVPETEGGTHSENEDEGSKPYMYDIAFSTLDELTQKFLSLIKISKLDEVYIYPQNGISFGFSEFSEWSSTVSAQMTNGYVSGYTSSSDGTNYLRITWYGASDDPYIRLQAEPLEMHIGQMQQVQVYQLHIPDQIPPVWSSSNETIATVDQDGRVTAHSAGKATITAMLGNGFASSVEVEVFPDYIPDFALSVTPGDTGVLISWNAIRGVTEYQVFRRVNGADHLLTTATFNQAEVNQEVLPPDELSQIYVVAKRVVDGQDVLTYTSEGVRYGTLTFSYQCSLPAGMTSIDDAAFQNTGVGNVCIPDGVSSIGAYAFAGCSNMQAVKIPDSVTVIGAGAFDSAALQYAVVEEGSYAHTWFVENCPSVILVYE